MNFISRIIKSINAMRERLKIERHEAMYGPHFNEECALKAVSYEARSLYSGRAFVVYVC